MKFRNFFPLLLLGLCAGATLSLAQDNSEAHRKEQLQASFAHFPLLTPATNSAGQPEFQILTFKDPVAIDGKNYYGFRFTVPPRSRVENMIWAMFMPITDYFEWDILPEKGKMPELSNYLSVPRSDYWAATNLLPTNRDWLILQTIPGKILRDGQTYLIWGTYAGKEQDVSMAFTFAHLGTNEINKRRPMEKALGLSGPMSPPMINPANHHRYMLLRPDTWKSSEAQAVALGGHLATIRNQAEEDWIVKTFGSYHDAQRLLWIGLSDRDKKFHFTWSSGESASYTCWAKGEPNNAGKGEDFVAVYYPHHKQGGKWNDWSDRTHDPIGLPIQGVVEIVPLELDPKVARATGDNAPPGNAAENVPAVQILPKVVITSEGGSIKLQWPVSDAHYMLETTTNLAEQFTMFGYTEFTNADAGMIYATITNPAPQMFFRLRQP